jgi:hypothetical protein
MAQRVGFSLEIDARKQTLDTLADIDSEIKDINAKLREAKKLGQTGVYRQLFNEKKKLRDEAKKLNRELKEENLQLGDLVDNFRIGFVRVGDFRAGITNAQKGMSLFTKATFNQIKAGKALKTLFISSGVGALVVALGSLVSWLRNTQEGMDFLERATSAVNAVIDVLIDRASKFGEGLVNIFSGNFRQGFRDLGDSIKGIGAELVNDIKATDQLTKSAQALKREEQGLNVILAERRKVLKELSKDVENQALTEEQRKKAGEEALKVSQQITDLENRFLDKKIENLREQLALGNSTLEQEQELADLIAERENRETSNLEAQTTIQNKLNVLTMGAAKAHEELKKAVEGSLDSMVEKLGQLNEELAGGNLAGDENALRDKLREIVELEEEIEALNAAITRARTEAGLGAAQDRGLIDGPSADQLERDPLGAGFGGLGEVDPAQDPEVTRDAEIQLALAESRQTFDEAERERMKEEAKKRQDLREQEAEEQQKLIANTYDQLADATGEFYAGELETIGDFSKKALGVVLDFIEKQLDAQLVGIQARLIGQLGPVGGAAAYFGIRALLKGLLAKAKSSVSQLELGGQLNPGFVAKGPRHVHGGIPIGNLSGS